MTQREIMALLVEASDKHCPSKRLNDIHIALRRALPEGVSNDEDRFEEGRRAELEHVLDKVYLETIAVRPALLPSLFPIFALLCGDRGKDSIMAEIDWSLA